MILEAVSPSTEQLEYEQINRVELVRALDDFALARGANLALDSQRGSLALASASPIPAIEGKTEGELRKIGYADMHRSYDLLERIDPESENEIEPGCTVCIPLAIFNGKDVHAMPRVVSNIRKSQAAWGRDVNVVIWANGGYTQSQDQTAVTQQAEATYQTLKARLEPLAGEGVRIMTALEVLPKEKPYLEIMTINEAAMSRVRSHYEDAVGILAGEKAYGFDHPVIWLDADIQDMPSNALRDLSDATRRFDALVPPCCSAIHDRVGKRRRAWCCG